MRIRLWCCHVRSGMVVPAQHPVNIVPTFLRYVHILRASLHALRPDDKIPDETAPKSGGLDLHFGHGFDQKFHS